MSGNPPVFRGNLSIEDQTRGAIAHRVLEERDEVLVLYPTIFGTRLGIGATGVGWLNDVWCYEDVAKGLNALAEWDGEGEPTGWHRHPRSRRYRTHGDPAQEYVNDA